MPMRSVVTDAAKKAPLTVQAFPGKLAQQKHESMVQ
jgi:hypothetical protein